MDVLCRICLSIDNPIECKLTEESAILYKLRTCLNIQINLTNTFPNSLCEICLKKIEEFNVFRENVLHNEHKLTDMLHENTLNDFYTNFKENLSVKDEKDIFNIKDKSIENFDDDYFDTVNKIPLIEEEQENTIKKEKKKGKNNKKVKLKKKKLTKTTIAKNIPKNVKKRVMQLYKIDSENTHDPLKCLMCFNIFESQEELSKHYRNDHTMTREQINEQNKNNDFSDKYTMTNNDRINYKCNTCAESFDSTNEVIEHIKNHALERPYICKLCGRTYMTVYAIVRHGRVHGGYKRYCAFGCGYSSPHGGAIRDHERRHNNEHNYKCKECGKGFMVRTWYEQHQNIHNNVRPFVCDFCGLAFHMHRYLMAHRNKVHPDLSAIRRYMCVHCSYTCETKMRLDTHIKMEHRKGEESGSNHLCDICGKTFSRVEGLTNHKKVHYGIRPFVCGLCNKTFSKKYNLQVHMRIHNTEQKNKPQCNTCGKFFAQKSTLHRHIRRRHPDEL